MKERTIGASCASPCWPSDTLFRILVIVNTQFMSVLKIEREAPRRCQESVEMRMRSKLVLRNAERFCRRHRAIKGKDEKARATLRKIATVSNYSRGCNSAHPCAQDLCQPESMLHESRPRLELQSSDNRMSGDAIHGIERISDFCLPLQ